MNWAHANTIGRAKRIRLSDAEDVDRMRQRSRERMNMNRKLAHVEYLERRVHELQSEVERLSEVAFRDPVTDLSNRRYFDERIQQELSRAHRRNEPLSIIMIDIDRFKLVNDRFGHAVGDEALRWVAKVLQTSQRKMDVIARVGGDEFALILPATDREGAEKRAERIRRDLSAIGLPAPLSELDLSIGISAKPARGNPENLLETADLAMYAEKRAKTER